MFIDATGLILADDKRLNLGELTRFRAFAAVPFAGRFRLVDFVLSNMVNSGIVRVGVATSNKYKSLMDHLGTGSSWDLDRKNQGLHILPPYLASDNYYDEGDDLRGVLDFLFNTTSSEVVIATANNVYNLDYAQYMQQHRDSGADMTVLYNNDVPDDGVNLVMELDKDGRVTELYRNPRNREFTANSLGVVFISKDLLVEIISDSISRGVPRLTIDLLLEHFKTLDIRAVNVENTVLRINSVKSYFNASMQVLNPEINQSVFWDERQQIYTKVKDEAPAYIVKNVTVKNSLVSDGCFVKGNVEDSILFRNVEISEGSCLQSCVVMQGTKIGRNVKLSNVILDKDCEIHDGKELRGSENYPLVIGKGAIV